MYQIVMIKECIDIIFLSIDLKCQFSVTLYILFF